ncbi:MAG: thiamine diphosphokinase [Faecousia sp.]
MRRCVIVGGAEIRDYPTIRQYLRGDDFFLFCDSGLRHMGSLNAVPDLIVGDFDSHANPHMPVETIVLPREKDDTDTVFAMKTAVERGFCDFLLLGVIGGRLDHTLANVSALLWLHHQGKTAVAVDDYSELEIVSANAVQIPPQYPFFSLLNISGTAEGITIKNAKYPLENAAIQCDYQYGVSNEVLPGRIAEVSVAKGELLLIKDRI